MQQVNFAGAWAKAWGVLSQGNSTIFVILTVVGVLIVVAAIVMAFFQSKRGGVNKPALWSAIGIGTLLSAPQAVIPLLLLFVDLLVNTVLRLLNLS